MKIDTKTDFNDTKTGFKMDSNGCAHTRLTDMPRLADMPMADVKPSAVRLTDAGCGLVSTDPVAQPEHYKQGWYEVIDEMLLVFGPQRTYDFCIMNAWKYRARAMYKGNTKQDMEKADQYLSMAKEIMDKNPQQYCHVNLIREP